jgi:hypothetical protein
LQHVHQYPHAHNDLLRLALIFSGLRTRQDATPLIKRYKTLSNDIQKQLQATKNIHEKGRKLLTLFHRRMLKTPANLQTTQYQLNQTRIDVLLRQGTFNCLSSSIVFGLLAKQAGFQVTLALLPSHVFVELRHPQLRRTISVETTSPKGYDHKHTTQYYQTRQREWAQARGLRPTTYEDYLKRTTHSLRHIICRMTLWKHLLRISPKREGRRRLREMAGYLDPHPRLQQNRLATWINTFQTLRQQNQRDLTRKLFRLIGPTLSGLSRQMTPSANPRYKHFMALLHLYWLEVSLETNQTSTNDTTQVYQRTAHHLSTVKPYSSELHRQLRWILGHLLNRLATQETPDSGRRWLARSGQLHPSQIRYYRSLFWNHFGNRQLQQKQWKEAINAYRHCVRDTQPKPDTTCQQNLRAAHHNWAVAAQAKGVTLSKQGKWQAAISAFQQCIQRSKTVPRIHDYCHKSLAATYYNWSVHLLRQKDTTQAKQILNTCRQLPRPLPECQQLLKQLSR